MNQFHPLAPGPRGFAACFVLVALILAGFAAGLYTVSLLIVGAA